MPLDGIHRPGRMVNHLWRWQSHIEARWVAHELIISQLRVLRQEDCEVERRLHHEIVSKKTKTRYLKSGLRQRRS